MFHTMTWVLQPFPCEEFRDREEYNEYVDEYPTVLQDRRWASLGFYGSASRVPLVLSLYERRAASILAPRRNGSSRVLRQWGCKHRNEGAVPRVRFCPKCQPQALPQAPHRWGDSSRSRQHADIPPRARVLVQ